MEVALGPVGDAVLDSAAWEVGGGWGTIVVECTVDTAGSSVGCGCISEPPVIEGDWGSDTTVVVGDGIGGESVEVFVPVTVPVAVVTLPVPVGTVWLPPARTEVLAGRPASGAREIVEEVVIGRMLIDPVADALEVRVKEAVADPDLEEEAVEVEFAASQDRSKRGVVETVVPTTPN